MRNILRRKRKKQTEAYNWNSQPRLDEPMYILSELKKQRRLYHGIVCPGIVLPVFSRETLEEVLQSDQALACEPKPDYI